MKYSLIMALMALELGLTMAAPATQTMALTQPTKRDLNPVIIAKPPRVSPVCNGAKTWTPDDLTHAIKLGNNFYISDNLQGKPSPITAFWPGHMLISIQERTDIRTSSKIDLKDLPIPSTTCLTFVRFRLLLRIAPRAPSWSTP